MDVDTATILFAVIGVGVSLYVALSAQGRALRRDLTKRVSDLDASLSARIDGLELRIETVRNDLGARIDRLELRIETVRTDLGARIDRLEERVQRLEERVDGLMKWLVEIFRGQTNEPPRAIGR